MITMITMTITMISMMSITFHNVEPFITTYLPTCGSTAAAVTLGTLVPHGTKNPGMQLKPGGNCLGFVKNSFCMGTVIYLFIYFRDPKTVLNDK